MIEDSEIKPASNMAIYSYIVSQDSTTNKLSGKSLADYMTEATSNSIVANLRKATAMTKNGTYAYGPLTSSYTFKGDTDIASILASTLSSITGSTIAVKYADHGFNYYHFARYMLNEYWRYNLDTNEVVNESNRLGFSVYLKDIVITLSELNIELDDPDTRELLGSAATSGYTPFRVGLPRAHTPIKIVTGESDPSFKVVFTYKDSAGKEVTYETVLSYSNYISSNQPPSTALDDTNVVKDDPNVISPTLPTNDLDREYIMSQYTEAGVTKLLTYVYGSRTIPQLENIFKEIPGLGNYAPRIYARMKGKKCNAEDLEDTDKYKAMKRLCNKLGFNWSEWVDTMHDSIDNLRYVREMYVNFGVPINDGSPVVAQYLYHYFLQVYKSLPNIAYLPTNTQKIITSFNYRKGATFTLADTEHKSGITFQGIGLRLFTGKVLEVGEYAVKKFTGGYSIQYQLTAKTYYQINIIGLTSFAKMDGSTTLTGSTNETIIPLDISISANLLGREKEILYMKSMHVVINTSQTVKKKWYQTGIFKVIVFIIAVVVSYFFPPAAFAAYGAMAGVYAALVTVAVAVAISLVTRILVKNGVGGKALESIMTVIAIVAIIYGGYLYTSNAAGIGGVTAQGMLTVANGAFSLAAVGRTIQMNKMLDEYQKLLGDFSEKSKNLEDKARELGLWGNSDASIFIFEQPNVLSVRIGEDPEDYFSRSIHEINIGPAVYDYQESYVEVSTALPTIQTMYEKLEQLTNG